jgi:hypothetical protein
MFMGLILLALEQITDRLERIACVALFLPGNACIHARATDDLFPQIVEFSPTCIAWDFASM